MKSFCILFIALFGLSVTAAEVPFQVSVAIEYNVLTYNQSTPEEKRFYMGFSTSGFASYGCVSPTFDSENRAIVELEEGFVMGEWVQTKVIFRRYKVEGKFLYTANVYLTHNNSTVQANLMDFPADINSGFIQYVPGTATDIAFSENVASRHNRAQVTPSLVIRSCKK